MVKLLCYRCAGHGIVDESRLAKLQLSILNTVRNAKAGITIHDLVDAVYADDPNGGPLHAINTVQGTIIQMNRRLTVSGVQIKATRLGRGALYKLVPTDAGPRRTIFRRTSGSKRADPITCEDATS